MKPQKMRKMGIIFLTIGIISTVLMLICWVSFIPVAISSDNPDSVVVIYVLFANFAILSYFAYAAIPLLIVSGIKLNREKAEKEQINLYGYCIQCGAPRHKDDAFCSKCGNRLE